MNTPANWRLRKQWHNLEGEICQSCGVSIFPPRDICPNCGEEAGDISTFSGLGEVFTFTTIYNAPDGFEDYVPYTVAIVKLEEGSLLTTQLTDVEPENVYIGMPVEMVTRKIREEGEEGLIVYGYKFRPRIR